MMSKIEFADTIEAIRDIFIIPIRERRYEESIY